jgi:hypothetical protein
MKNTLKILSTLGLVLCALGFMFKVQHWPGASAMTVFGSIPLFIYFLLAVSEAEQGKKITSFLLNVGFAIFTMGTLFKIQHWPWGNILLTLGLGLFIPLFGLFKSVASLKLTEQKMAHFLFYFGAMFLPLGILFWLMQWPGFNMLLAISGVGLALMTASGIAIYSIDKSENRFTTNQFVRIVFICLFLLQALSNRIPNRVLDNNVVMYNDLQQQLNQEVNYGNDFLASGKLSWELTVISSQINKDEDSIIFDKKRKLYVVQCDTSLVFISKKAHKKVLAIDAETAKCIERIDALKYRLLEFSGENIRNAMQGDPTSLVWKKYDKKNPLQPAEFNLMAITNKFQAEAAYRIIIGEDPYNPTGEGRELWQNLLAYRFQLLNILSGSKPIHINVFKDAKDLNKKCMAMLESMKVTEGDRAALAELYIGLTKPEKVKSFNDDEPDYHWIGANFEGFSLVSAMVQLSRLEFEVLQARTKALKILAAQERDTKSTEVVKKP